MHQQLMKVHSFKFLLQLDKVWILKGFPSAIDSLSGDRSGRIGMRVDTDYPWNRERPINKTPVASISIKVICL